MTARPCIAPPAPSPARDLLLATLDLMREDPDRDVYAALVGAHLRGNHGPFALHLAMKEVLAAKNRVGQFTFSLHDQGPEVADLLADLLGVSAPDTVPAPPPPRDTDVDPLAGLEMSCATGEEAALWPYPM